MSAVTPLITVPGREVLISVILKQVRKLFCQSHSDDNDGVESPAYPLQSSSAANSPTVKFPGGGGDIVIIEGERGRLEGAREGERRGASRSGPGDVFAT